MRCPVHESVMDIPDIKVLVFQEGNVVRFQRFEDSQLWYDVWYADGDKERNFEFPIPIADAAGGIFLAEDTPKFFMRWIRSRIEFWKNVEHSVRAGGGE